jgi:hypothetical protein
MEAFSVSKKTRIVHTNSHKAAFEKNNFLKEVIVIKISPCSKEEGHSVQV